MFDLDGANIGLLFFLPTFKPVELSGYRQEWSEAELLLMSATHDE